MAIFRNKPDFLPIGKICCEKCLTGQEQDINLDTKPYYRKRQGNLPETQWPDHMKRQDLCDKHAKDHTPFDGEVILIPADKRKFI